MSRVKRGVTIRRRHKQLLSLTKGYKHGRKNIFRQAKQALLKAKTYSYRDRKVKKRDFRSLWIIRVNAAVRSEGLNYSEFMHGLTQINLKLDRKSLSHLALHEPKSFKTIVDRVKTELKK